MILVTLGTQDKAFTRLIDKISLLVNKGIIKEKVIVQAGYTSKVKKYDNLEMFDYCDNKKMQELVSKASLIISHAGAGSIIAALEHKKKIIVVPRLSKYGEHNNDHQIEIAEKFSKDGFIYYLKDLNKLDEAIDEIKKMKFNTLGHNEEILNTISSFVESISIEYYRKTRVILFILFLINIILLIIKYNNIKLIISLLIFFLFIIFSIIQRKKREKKKVIFVSSLGGHLTQMLELKSLFNNYNYLLITEKSEVTKDLKDKYNTKYYIYCNKKNFIKYFFINVINAFHSCYTFLVENPDVIVTTGANTSVPLCYLGFIFRRKVIFIESFAKKEGKSLAGQLVYPIASIFIVQWESMLKYYPKAIYFGGIY